MTEWEHKDFCIKQELEKKEDDIKVAKKCGFNNTKLESITKDYSVRMLLLLRHGSHGQE